MPGTARKPKSAPGPVTVRRRVLVTGAAGFLGRYLAREFCRAGYEVRGLGHGNLGPRERHAWGIGRWREGDISLAELTSVLDEREPPDVIVHAAGGASVAASWSEPWRDFERTVASTAAVIEAARTRAPGVRLVYISSAAVYGCRAGARPVAEGTPPAPVSPYGEHKLHAERLCLAAARFHGMDVRIVRYFSLYGPGLRKQLLWDVCGKLAERPEELTLWGTGDEGRDFLHVEDAARLCRLVAECAGPPGLVVNGGSGRTSTIRAVANLIAASFVGRTALSFNRQVRIGDPRHLVADVTRARRLGFRPKRTLERGLAEYAAWATAELVHLRKAARRSAA